MRRLCASILVLLVAAIGCVPAAIGQTGEGQRLLSSAELAAALEAIEAKYKPGSAPYAAAVRNLLETSVEAGAPVDPGSARSGRVGSGPSRDFTEAPRAEAIERDPRMGTAVSQTVRAEIEDRGKFESAGQPRIYKGITTIEQRGQDRRDLFRHTIALRGTGSSTICSGVVVAPRTILTAQHCLCDLGLQRGGDVIVGSSVGNGDRHRIAGIRGYARRGCDKAAMVGQDLGLVFIEAPLAEYAEIVPMSALQARPVLWISGFGRTEQNTSGVKLRARVAVVSPSCTDPRDRNWRCVPGSEAILTDRERGADSCFGDSGGPALLEVADGRFDVVGIVSRGLPGTGCGKGGIYSLITPQFVRWMIEAISKYERAASVLPRAGIVQALPLQGGAVAGGQATPSTATGRSWAAFFPGVAAPSQSRSLVGGGYKQCVGQCPQTSTMAQCSQKCLCEYQCAAEADAATCAQYCSPGP
jgi:hypothetical protein